jgi:hypothetical protein
MYLHELYLVSEGTVDDGALRKLIAQKFSDLIKSDRERLMGEPAELRGKSGIAAENWTEAAARIKAGAERLREANADAAARLPLNNKLAYPDGNPAPYKIEAALWRLFPSIAGTRVVSAAVEEALDGARAGARWDKRMWPTAARIMLEKLTQCAAPIWTLAYDPRGDTWKTVQRRPDGLAGRSRTPGGAAAKMLADPELARRAEAVRGGKPGIEGAEDRVVVEKLLSGSSAAQRQALMEVLNPSFRGGPAPTVAEILMYMASPKPSISAS